MAISSHRLQILISARNLSGAAFGGLTRNLRTLGLAALGALGARGLQGLISDLGKRSGQIMDVANAFENLAQSIGMSSKQWLADLRSASAGTITDLELMKTANQAVLLTGKFLAKDLPQYLRIARVAAQASGESMEFLFSSLVRGVARGSPMIIDNALITLSAAEAYETYARKIGKATDQLTKSEQQMATHEATLRAGAAMLAKVGDASGTLSMQFQQLRVRAENLYNELAMKLAPAFSVLMDQLIKGADQAEQAGRAFFNKYKAEISRIAENALRWGVNISTQLATGIVQGASQALIAAMNFVGNLLSSWLAPGSPPKVAPGLVKWGISAMDHYLSGFAKADFDALSNLQGPLQTALQALVGMGQLKQGDAGKLFASLSVDLARTISQFGKTGEVGSGIFERLKKVGGEFGGHLAKMLRSQLDLVRATKALKAAQDRLNQAREAEDKALDDVKRLKKEYFELRKAGASKEQLRAKYAEIKAAQEGLKQSREETKAAEEAEKEARKKLDPIREQLDLQREMVQQLAQLVQMQAQAFGGAGAGAGAGAGVGAIALPAPDTASFVGGLQAAFEEAKKGIAQKLRGIFAPLREAIQSEMGPALDELREKWKWFKGILEDFWNSEPVKNIREWFAKAIPDDFLTTVGKVTGAILVAAVAFGILKGVVALLGGILGALFSPLGLLVALSTALYLAWSNNWLGIRDIVQSVWTDTLLPTFEALKAWFETNWPLIQAAFLTVWTIMKDAVMAFVDVIMGVVWPNIQLAFENIKALLGESSTTWADIWNGVVKVLQFVATAIGVIIASIMAVVIGLISGIAKGIATFTAYMGYIKDAADHFWQSLKQVFQGLSDFLVGLFTGDFQRAFDGLVYVIVGAANSILALFTVIATGITAIVHTILATLAGFVEAVVKFFLDLYYRLIGHSIVTDMLADIVGAFTGIDWLGLGSGIIDGIKDGVVDAASRLWEAAKDAVLGALQAAKEAIWSHSPSKRAAREIGIPIMEGIAAGIAKGAALPKSTLAGAMGGVLGAGRPAMVGAGVGGGVMVIVQGDVWSDRKVQEIADRIARLQPRKGIRRYSGGYNT